MDEQLQEDWLDAQLREEAPYIDDAGFTARVVQQLPAGRRQSRVVRVSVLLGVTFVACVIAYLVSGGGRFLADAATFLVAMPLATVCAIAGLCAITVMGVSAYAAASNARELRL
ncbi:MAG: hypothetical protein H0X73_01520 [Chthoniobacterales bacterium]|nr:hypothetical protein [Chthoniobacterales bacterium]